MRRLLIPLMLVATAAAGLCQDQTDPPAPAEVPAGPQVQSPAQAMLVRARWPDQDLTNTAYRVFSDAAMRELVDVFPAGGPNGTALIVLRPGRYWINAVVDTNANGRPDAGDGLGWHGVHALSRSARPQPIEVSADTADTIVIPILVRLTEDGGMEPLPWAQALVRGTVVGTVAGAGDATVVVALLPVSEDGKLFVGLAGEDGAFSLEAAPGAYQLIAASDADGDGRLTDADPKALVQSGDAPVAIVAEQEVQVGTLSLVPCAAPPGVPPIVAGRITGVEPGEGAKISLALCTDAAMRQEAVALAADADGRFAATVEPGSYYLRATVDQAGDDMLGPGDMVGFYGVSDLLGGDTPQPLEVSENALHTDVTVAMSATIDEQGRLSAYRPAQPEDEAEDAAGD